MTGRWCTKWFPPQFHLRNIHFHFAHGFATLTLASMLDSLVRVSRRAVGNHFVTISLARAYNRESTHNTSTLHAVKTHYFAGPIIHKGTKQPHSSPEQDNTGYNNARRHLPSYEPSPPNPSHGDLPQDIHVQQQH